MVASVILVVFITLSGYVVFALAMGTSTPLVVVTSGSMQPALHRGDLLVIQARSEDQINVDDIVVYNADWLDTPIVHRVIEIIEDTDDERLFKTKGDYNYNNDSGYRVIDDIIGVVILTIPFVGHISLFIQTIEGKIIVFAIILLLVVGPEARERIRKAESHNKET